MSLIGEMARRREALLEILREIVTLESPSTDKAAVDRLARLLQERCRELGAEVDVYPQAEYGDLTVASWPARGRDAEPLLVMTHIDTVWPLGTIERRPFVVEDDVARGPGVFDMKASVAMMLEAVRWLEEQGLEHRAIRWLINTEEEVGSPVSRPLIEELARQSGYVLCLEPPVPPMGALKTSRKGVGIFTVRIRGRAAHAGADPEKGISAIQELANQIHYLHSLTDFSLGTTVNVGVVGGGTRPNVVAEEAWARVDLRVSTMAEAERAVAAILGSRPWLPGAEVTVEGGLNRPPMERTPSIVAAFERAREIGRQIGLELTEAATGGASDGNFTAALGVPTIDGLGCPGDGGHAEHEHIRVSGLIERTALLIALLHEL
ncbi:M20 family metallopeptidase [Thermomicrobiaceae bacterium CFH 74404]|uniref:M20 family metallopeptidase n=1 Tax=Thermalbibacter longus TaxID=2951981 RepID=A0AA41W9U4_9BACT|nr:M20 family metallopeptidase [Thermalbibacter longus]MCM8748594.1 M20 family metallopeptidase [Thermalbibacter longus]